MADNSSINVSITDIINAITQVLIAITALVSAIMAFKSFYHGKKRQKIDKAIQLAQLYQERILVLSNVITESLRGSNFDKYSTIAFGKIRQSTFTNEEMIEHLTQKAHITEEKYLDLLTNVDAGAVFAAKNTYEDYDYRSHMKISVYMKAVKNNDEKTIESAQRSAINDLTADITELANTLEWFSMYFVNGIADDDTAYQSLHQTFLGIVRQLYYFFAKNNKDAHDKYYTNTIALYNRWQARSEHAQLEEIRIKGQATSKVQKLAQPKKKIN